MIKEFVERWKNCGDEKSDTQKFWLELLHDVLGVENPGALIDFEKRVTLEHKSFIDAYITETRVLIEQKSYGIDLTKWATQSDGFLLTPFEQAKRYADWLPDSEHPRWIVICNFQEFHVHDMEFPKAPPEIIRLEDLESDARKLLFLVNPKAATPKEIRELQISEQAGELVGKLYDALLTCYTDPNSPESQRSLNILCVRIVFLLYAEDSGLFKKGQFHDYILAHKDSSRRALMDLFTVLSQELDERDKYTDEDLMAFPYVNGGLFEEANIEIPQLTTPKAAPRMPYSPHPPAPVNVIEGAASPLDIIIHEMSEGFDWSGISPTIFGAIFESTLREGTRRENGMHYTTIENIHRVIDPLFMNELTATFNKLRNNHTKLKAFRKELTTLKFFDPACGSGNFLTETYLSLCRLEIKIVNALGELPLLSVSIEQFYGIEINNFAVAVAKTALWIANIQMSKEINPKAVLEKECLPLKKFNHNIIEANALTYDWSELVKPAQVSYIMGNPPFVGHQWRNKQQNDDMKLAFHDLRDHGKLDYVCSWYNKAADFINGTRIKAAFVSTNSVCQGESVSILWKFMRDKGVNIFMAYKPFIWTSESRDKAHVHCVIVGFTRGYEVTEKFIYTTSGKVQPASHINGYLLNAPDVFITNRGKPADPNMPIMKKGSQPTDDGNLILSPKEREELLTKYPEAEKFIKRYMGAREFIHNEMRYCLWLEGVTPNEYRHITPIMNRLEKVAAFRRTSPTKSVQAAAETPGLFTQIRQPNTNFLAVAKVSSETRKYIPMGFVPPDVIVSDGLQIVSYANLFMFGILESSVHMAWTNVVAGRLEMRFSYTPAVYNNFPWPEVNYKQRMKIESCAKKILDAREKFPEASLADLYDPLTMPAELLKVHRENDKAVCEAYGWKANISEEEIVARLMELYVRKTNT